MALFRAFPGQAQALRAAALRHAEVLRQERLLTTRPVLTLSSDDSSVVLQLLEWDESPDASTPTKSAHTDPVVQQVWSELAAHGQFLPFGTLAQPLLPRVIFLAVRPTAGKEESVRRLLVNHARVVRQKNLTGQRQVFTFQSDVDRTFLQMIEASNSGGVRQIAEDRDLQKIRAELARTGRVVKVSALSESPCSFLSLALVSEN